jgi:cytochrome c oxidase subunit IV
MADHVTHTSEHGAEHHGISERTYLIVLAALMILLIITLAAAIPNLGYLNLPIAMIIAFVKAGIVVTYFMHLKLSSKLVKFFALAALFWLVIMFLLTFGDYFSRGWLPQAGK